MSTNITDTASLKEFLSVSSGFSREAGDTRVKHIINKILTDICKTIEEFDISDEEFWHAVNYLNELGERKEVALLAAGLGLEHFLDLRADEIDSATGITGGTPRTIEGPLYVANAPLSDSFARMDDGNDNGQAMWLCGQVKDKNNQPIENAIVDVWHANTSGSYSFFDKSQSDFNLRRRIRTDKNGYYSARSILPSGYGCPPDGPTQALLNLLGRHGNRPAHIHFFVSAPGYKHLTTQINLSGDEYLWDDFAFATRDGLIANPVKIDQHQAAAERDIPLPYVEVNFDFTLVPAQRAEEEDKVKRVRAE